MGESMNYKDEYSELEKNKVSVYLQHRKIKNIEFRKDDIEITLDDGSLIEGEIDIDFILTEIEEAEKEKNCE
jgi:hypothetical protein